MRAVRSPRQRRAPWFPCVAVSCFGPRLKRRSGLARPRTALFLSLREAYFVLPSGLRPCRSGGASSAALRPACACDRAGRPAVGPLAVSRRSLRSGGSIDTPPRDARSGPARSGAIGLHPLGGFGHPPPRQADFLLPSFRVTTLLDLQQDLRPVGGGVVDPPVPRVAIGSCARGPRTGEPRRGVDGPERSEGNSEGPRRGSPCPVAGTGACGLGRGGARARIRPPAGPARKTPRSGRRNAASDGWPEYPQRGMRCAAR